MSRPRRASGFGAIISKEGHIITNYHVIEGVQMVQVTTNDNKSYKARVINGSKSRDIALLKIESDRKDFPALTFADSDKTRVGQVVFAVGNSFGLSRHRTQGIISGRDRHLSDGANDYLQTDTVIRPGNSRRTAGQHSRRDPRHQRRHLPGRPARAGLAGRGPGRASRSSPASHRNDSRWPIARPRPHQPGLLGITLSIAGDSR